MTERTAQRSESGIVIGIDLGTTNSLAAVPGAKGPVIVRDRDGEALIPSVVCFREDGTRLTGRPARDRILDLPDRTVFSVKRLIGRAGEEVDEEARRLPYPVRQGERGLARVVIDGREYSPEEISAMVLREVATTAEAALAMPVKDCVITVPAYFDDGQRQATKDAAELAGLNCLRILNEPTAASLAYGIDGSRDGAVLVYDLGGGTFDVSVLRIQDGVFRVLATAGDTHLGGDDFDRLLAQRILAILKEQTGRDQELSPYVMQAVRRSAEGLKIQLSDQDEAQLHIDLGNGNAADLKITRSEFEDLIRDQVERTVDCLRRAVKDAGIAMKEIDELVLVGGSTRIPLVRRRLAEVTGREPHTEVDPDQAVALGAAIQADVLAGRNKDLLLLDVIPLSLGLETMGGVVSKMILRNATIPTSHTEEFSTQVDNQTGVDINIYQGERELTKDCRKLGAFKLSGIPPMPAGLPRIAVTFLVDADGVLRVRAVEQRTGNEASVKIVPSFGLTRDEVRRMMSESIEHAHEDMEAREAIELRNKAAAMVAGTRKALDMSDLPPDQSWSIRKAVKTLDGLLQRNAPIDEVRDAVDEVSRLTSQIADDVISSAVKKALTGAEAETP